MKQHTKATLLSALVLPGLGQLLVLKRTWRGLAFMLPSLLAFLYLMNGLLGAQGGGDPARVLEQLNASGSTPGAELASWVMIICWLASLLDALLLRQGD